MSYVLAGSTLENVVLLTVAIGKGKPVQVPFVLTADGLDVMTTNDPLGGQWKRK